MVAALTTAAVINHSMYPPDEYIPWTAFAPSRKAFKSQASGGTLSEEQKRIITEHNIRVLELTARLKAEKEKECQSSQTSEQSSTSSEETHSDELNEKPCEQSAT